MFLRSWHSLTRTPSRRRGFTLIELLVVIAIIAILSTIALASLSTMRGRARDARRRADFRNISTAIQMFYDANGRMPANYHPGVGACDDGTGYYNSSMQELVSAGYLSRIPLNPGGNIGYCYYDYGPGNNVGALLVTFQEQIPNSVNGVEGTCRPWAVGQNWCDQSNSKFYCICIPY